MEVRPGCSDRKPEGGETLMNFLKWMRFWLELRIEFKAGLNNDQE
jgi:hypothetical protein